MKKIDVSGLADWQKAVIKYCQSMEIMARFEHENYGRDYDEISKGFAEVIKRTREFISSLDSDEFYSIATLESMQSDVIRQFNEQLRDKLEEITNKNEPPTDVS